MGIPHPGAACRAWLAERFNKARTSKRNKLVAAWRAGLAKRLRKPEADTILVLSYSRVVRLEAGVIPRLVAQVCRQGSAQSHVEVWHRSLFLAAGCREVG